MASGRLSFNLPAGVVALLLTLHPWLSARAQEGPGLQYPVAASELPSWSVAPPAELVPEQGLSLEQLEHLALALNPSIRRVAALVGAARGNSLQRGLLPNPSVGYEGQQLGSGGEAEQHGVVFSQEIVRGGKLRLDRAVAVRERMRIEQLLAAQEMRVRTDVRIAYYHVLLAQRQLGVADDLLRINEEGAQAVEELFRANEAGRAESLQAQLELENARGLGETARHRHHAAWQSLVSVVGNPSLSPRPVLGDAEGPLPTLDFEETLARLVQLSPEVSAAEMEIERARLAWERARVEPTPNLQVQGIVNWQDNGIGGKPNGGIAVTIPFPIFDRNQGGIARTEQEWIAARQGLAQVRLELQQRLAVTFEGYANARHQVERYRQSVLPAAQELLELTRTLYGAGESSYTALLTAQRTYSKASLDYLDALRVLRVTEAEIEGLLLRGSLQVSTMDSLELGAIELSSGSGRGVEHFRNPL